MEPCRRDGKRSAHLLRHEVLGDSASRIRYESQRSFAERALPLRQRLLDDCRSLLSLLSAPPQSG
jgi:hypothetical protein